MRSAKREQNLCRAARECAAQSASKISVERQENAGTSISAKKPSGAGWVSHPQSVCLSTHSYYCLRPSGSGGFRFWRQSNITIVQYFCTINIILKIQLRNSENKKKSHSKTINL